MEKKINTPCPKIVAVIQARMGSKRCPGKMLKHVEGKPLLVHIIERARAINKVSEIVVATSREVGDNALAELAIECGVIVVRGPEDNVLERYMIALAKTDADIIIRITGDATLFDPKFIDYWLDQMIVHNAEYGRVMENVQHAHEGAGALTASALRWVFKNGRENNDAREHVTLFANKHHKELQTIELNMENSLLGNYHLSVDSQADLDMIRWVYSKFYRNGTIVDLRECVKLMQEEGTPPWIVHEENRQISVALIRCDASHRIGYGHLVRCLELAKILKQEHGFRVVFALREDQTAADKIRKTGFLVITSDETVSGWNVDEWFGSLAKSIQASVVVLDMRDDLAISIVDSMCQSGILIVSLDDPSERAFASDIAFFPPVPHVLGRDWNAYKGSLNIGWEWVLLRTEFVKRIKKTQSDVNRILVTTGGSDLYCLTPMILRGLADLPNKLDITVVLGPAFKDNKKIRDVVKEYPHNIEVLHDVYDMSNVMRNKDLAIATYGVVAYELAACEVPSILIGITEEHAIAATAFEDEKIAVNLGHFEKIDQRSISNSVSKILKNEDVLRSMAIHASNLVDGRGVERIALKITNELLSKNERKKINEHDHNLQLS